MNEINNNGERENTMRIQINEVWNHEGRSKELAIIEASDNHKAFQVVYAWIDKNRPDLSLADSIDAHGFHARAL